MFKTFCSKRIMLILLIGSILMVLSAQSRDIILNDHKNETTLQSNNEYGFSVLYRVANLTLEKISTQKGDFEQINVAGFGQTHRIGEPQLPSSNRIVAVPLGAKLNFEVLRQQKMQLDPKDSTLKHRIFPAQAPISKSAEPSSINFAYNETIYSQKDLIGKELFSAQEIGIMRGVRLFLISFEPIRYNPQSGELEVCMEAEIKISFEHPDFLATRELRAKTASAEFEQLYAKSIFNWEPNRDSLLRHPTKMLVLCPPAYENAMQSYMTWKRKQGYSVNLVTIGNTAEIANSTNAISTYMTSLWNSATAADPAPTYLLIVGDTATSGNNVIANSGATGGHPTDLTYVRLEGADYLPEMYFGRFSVSNETELTRIIDKSIMFQQTAMPDLSYLGKTVLIAGVDANFAPTHGNGAINYGTTHYFNAANGIVSNNYLYPESGSSATQIRAHAAEGRGYMNYTAHGSQTSWSNPSFTAAQMTALENVNKPFVAVGNCCITNEFDYGSPCFGEAIIRAENAGVAYIGGTNSTYWDEDYYWAVGYKTPQTAAHPYNPNTLGAYDAMFQAPASVDDWAQTTGETVFMGNMAVQQSGSSRANYYWEIYSIMGDPSLMPYYGVPETNTALFPDAIMIGINTINISAAPQSRVALSMDGNLMGYGIVGSSGNLTLDFQPFTNPGTAELVISRSGMITRIEEIAVLPASGPFIAVESTEYGDNNNQLPEYNESGYLNVEFSNVGADGASNLNATLDCTTEGISIMDANESIGTLLASATVMCNNAFSFAIADDIEDATLAEFTITIQNGTETWNHAFTLIINAPALEFGNILIADPNGNDNHRLDPGETVTITVPLYNNGAAISPSGLATLMSNTTGITINSGSSTFPSISSASSSNLFFELSADESMQIGSIANLSFSANANSYSTSKVESLPIGLILEDFESGDFSMYAWELTGNESWYIDSAESHQGSYAAKSGTITHNQLSSLKVNRMLSNPGSISFWYKVSSESNYDWLRFYVDGNLKDEWSGTVDWSEASYDLTAGERELEWVYSKDGSVSNGSDCAWIDYIVFPASTAPSNLYPPRNLRAIPSDGRITLNWQAPSSGMADSYQIFKDNNLLATISSLSYQDDAVTNGIQYTYYVLAVYPEGNSDPSNIVTCTPGSYTEAIIGSGTESSAANASTPINIWYKSLHGQSIYTAAELNSAGMVGQSTITELGFYVTGAPVSPLPSFLIRMKHSSNPDVANWQSSQDMQLVYNTASYSPTEGGFDMITLTNPFIWNGVDNIVVDTAFGLLDNYDQSGTLQISDMTNGYRYVRNDNYDQSAVFSNGYTADYRPNIRFVFEAAASNEARILVEPANLEFADTAVGNSNSLSLRIRNMGDIALSGSITTPPSFSINQRTMASDEKDIRNTLDFSVAAGTYHDYPVIFAPAAIGEYSGNIQISSNAANSPTETIPLSGYGYLPPAISLDSEGLSANLQIGEEASDSFTITNAGGQTLEYSISLAEQRQLNANLSSGNQQRSISGSYLSVEPDSYDAGTTVDWEINVYNASPDMEWIKEVILTLPSEISINQVQELSCPSGTMDPSISGNTITWFGESDAGWGIIHDNETGTAIISVTIPSSYQGNMELPYTINGDVYNAEPHTISDTFTLIQNIPPVEWLELSNLSGSLNPGESTLISASFSAVGFSEGTYQAMLTISSNDPENPAYPLTATMQVSDLSNHAPVINLPPSFSFEKNGSLQIDLSSYASDPDNDPLSMQILGNSNVLCDINQMTVTLTAEQNWVGSETISIVVSDTELVASAQTVINVLPVNEPEWEPVNYPNNPATIYAMVNIEGYPAQANDQIAAFVGNECRGTADIVLGRDTAYATIIVQMAEPGETVYFKVYSYLDDTIYDADISVQPDFGDEIGADDPLLIDAGNTTSLDQPIVSISSSNDTLHLNWDAVLHADYYEIYSCATPDGEFQILSTATDTSFAIDSSHPHRFYRVLAVKGIATK